MSSRNPNSGTYGSSYPSPYPSPSPSPSPNSGENRENIEPQREEIQTDETVPKEEQSAAATADSTSKEEENPKQENPDEKIPNQENPVEEIPKPEIPEEEDPEEEDPEEEMPQKGDPVEEDPVEEIPKQENPDEEMPQKEDREEENYEVEDQEEEILEQENPEPEIPQQEVPEQANRHEEIPLEGDKLLACLSGIVPNIQMGEQQQMFADIQARNQQQAQIDNQEQVLEALPLSYAFVSDNLEDYGFFSKDSLSFKYENAMLDAMYAANRANEPNRGSGNNLKDNGFLSEDNESFKYENAILDAMYAANRANEPNKGSGNRGQENPTVGSIHSIATFKPNSGIGNGELYNPTIAKILAAIPTVDINRGLGIAEPENPTIADIFREQENPSDMLGSIFLFEPNKGIANRELENPIIAEMFASNLPIEPKRGNGNTEMLADLPPNKRIRMQENPTIDATFNSGPAINPNRGFTIRDPQNPTNNPAPAAVPEQQDKGKGKAENPRPTKNRKYCPERFLFPGSTSEEEDDIITMKFVSAYSRNQWYLPSAGSPEHFDTLFTLISSQLPQGESISLETLKEKFAKLVKKYMRLLRQREISLNFEALATNYDQELYRLGREVWGFAYAEGYRFPPGIVGTSGDSS